MRASWQPRRGQLPERVPKCFARHESPPMSPGRQAQARPKGRRNRRRERRPRRPGSRRTCRRAQTQRQGPLPQAPGLRVENPWGQRTAEQARSQMQGLAACEQMQAGPHRGQGRKRAALRVAAAYGRMREARLPPGAKQPAGKRYPQAVARRRTQDERQGPPARYRPREAEREQRHRMRTQVERLAAQASGQQDAWGLELRNERRGPQPPRPLCEWAPHGP